MATITLSPGQNISTAILSVNPGDTVLLQPGTYTERVWIGVSGNAGAWCTLRGEPGAIISAGSGEDGVVLVRATYWIIDGLELTGSAGAGVDASDTHHVIVRNCEPHHCGGSGLAAYQSDAVLFENNHVHHNANSSSYHTSGISLAAMRLLPGAAIDGSWRCVVRGNRCHDNMEISAPTPHTDGNGIIIDWNRNEDGRADPYFGPTLIEDNTCFRNGAKGIQVYLSDAVTVRKNTCYNNNLDTGNPGTARAEISLHETTGSTAEENISYAIQGAGILANNSSAMNQGAGNTWTDNCLYGGLGWMDPGTGPAAGTGNIYVDPQFTDAANDDFSLLPGSPAAGWGALQPEEETGMAVVTVLEADGITETDVTISELGRAAAAASKPIAMSTEDKAVLDNLATYLNTLQAIVTSNRAAVNPISGQTGVAGGTGTRGATTQRVTIATDDEIVTAITRTVTTATASYTRPADTTAYASGDCLSNSTSAPTAGGLTFTVASANGKGGLITDLLVTSSNAPGTPLQGELWLFDTAPTAVNDNAAFTVSDSEILTLVAKIPFALTTIGANSQAHVQGLNIGYTTVSATTLRGLVMATNAYTPASGEVVSFRLKTTPIG